MTITRRDFIKTGALAVGASLIRLPIVSASVAPKKIIIIGAGMAGLSAGYELSQAGHDITILEARAIPGGRVHTIREPFSDGLYAEAGAARIPDTHELTLKYVKLFDVPLEPMYPSKLSALRVNGNSKQDSPSSLDPNSAGLRASPKSKGEMTTCPGHLRNAWPTKFITVRPR